jgi:hypothetical protein
MKWSTRRAVTLIFIPLKSIKKKIKMGVGWLGNFFAEPPPRMPYKPVIGLLWHPSERL